MKLFIALSLLFPLTACGGVHQYHSPELLQYINQFEATEHSDTSSITIMMADTLVSTVDNAVGEAFILSQLIHIKTDFFEASDDTVRYLVLAHELGHALYKRQHREGNLEDTCPNSIMAAMLIPSWCYALHKDYYDNELKPLGM